MVVVLDPRRPRPYVLRDDRKLPPEKQTTWMVRGLTAREAAFIRDMESFSLDGNGQVSSRRVGASIIHRFQLCVVGWRNLQGAAGMVEFKTEDTDLFGKKTTVVSVDVLDVIPDPVVNEIALEIIRLTNLTEDDSKSAAPGGADRVGASANGLPAVPGT